MVKVNASRWLGIQTNQQTKEQLLLGSDKCWAINNTTAGKEWEGSSDTVNYAAMCQNNTGSNEAEFREVDLVAEYHTRVPTKVGKSTYGG